jgi:hypothetical protein
MCLVSSISNPAEVVSAQAPYPTLVTMEGHHEEHQVNGVRAV